MSCEWLGREAIFFIGYLRANRVDNIVVKIDNNSFEGCQRG